MTCEVSVILDSINPYNNIRLTTIKVRYWRAIHSELMTHRMFSRNASSSRAIPIDKMLKQVWNDPAGPIHWGANEKGMQANKELTGFKLWFTKKIWNFTGKLVCSLVWITNEIASPHKQIFNRLLEPWQYITVLITATEFENFFALRCHPDAQPEIQELAMAMEKAMRDSDPTHREYHIPFILDSEKFYPVDQLMKLSTARCARISYITNNAKNINILNDISLHDRLVGSVPIHASPTEHQAIAQNSNKFFRNFKGWDQYRSEVESKYK